MAEKALPRLTRMLGIVTRLEERGDTTVDELAEHFGVTPSQIRKDVGLLWVTGLPGYLPDDLLDFDGDALDQGRVVLWQGHGLTQVRISAREAVALVGALSVLVKSGAAPAAATTALAKLSAAVEGSDPVSVVDVAPIPPAISAALLDAVSRRRVADVTYVDAQDNRTERTIEPHRLVTIDGVAYVECFCRRAADYRTLRLDRIAQVNVTEDQVEVAPRDLIGFTLAARFTAEVRVARGARWAFEDLPGVSLVEDGDDVVATFGVADADWAASRLLSVATHLRTVEPQALRDALALQASAVAAAQAG